MAETKVYPVHFSVNYVFDTFLTLMFTFDGLNKV